MSALKPRIVAAMSGGVDSSVAAALLVEQGFDVIGVTLQLYGETKSAPGSKTCCAGRDIRDAKAVAATLGIPHYVLDKQERFLDSVIKPFAESYAKGETPIPCVLCNQTVKFQDLLGLARDLGAQALATGHYVQRVEIDGKAQLFKGADPVRDQSYFLFATTREQLEFLRFPLGAIRDKSETRAIAARHNLPVAEKPDSQDICFVSSGHYSEIVAHFSPEAARAGDIVDLQGRVLGQHKGVGRYTVGQRKGLGIGGGDALYVVKIDPLENRVVVGAVAGLGKKRIALRDVNWLGAEQEQIRCQAKVRSTRAPVEATAYRHANGGMSVELDAFEIGVSAGQACVLYQGDQALGGGFITNES